MLRKHKRNGSLFDIWSVIHFFNGVILGWLLDPFWALAIMVLWEPLEILVISPLVAKLGINFGNESLNNALSDIFFDVLGIVCGAYLLTRLIGPPIHLF